jgi:glycosyltransferase involved in cell wall biosynthesis
VVTSRFTAGRLGSYGVAARRVRVAVPGTAPAAAATGPEPGEPPRLLCVASLTPRKGHTVLLEALAGVADLAWSCVLAGSEALAPEHARTVRARASELGLDGRVRFLGELDRETLDGWYARSSLFVLASHYEGYGMALTEAIARALPVLSTTGGAIPYTVPAEAGVLVKPGDPDALGRALRSLLSEDSTLLDTLRAGAMREAAGLPDWPEAAKGFAEAVDEAATGPSPRRRTSVR